MVEDRSHNASSGSRQADERRATKDADLEALFKTWSAEAEPPPATAGTGVRLRLGITVVLVLLAGAVMYHTRQDLAWWLQPTEPVALGDVRALYREGKTLPPLSPESHVAITGLIPTRLVPVKVEGLSDGARPESPLEYIFYCPLAHALVVTAQPIDLPQDRMISVDPAYERLLSERLAFPEDLAVEVAVSGRLQRGDEAPSALAPFVERVARRLDLAPERMWVIQDGRRPADSAWAAVVWGLATLGVALSFFFLFRAIRAQRRARST